MKTRGTMNDLDPSWGLHHLGQGSYFQLKYLTKQCDKIEQNLDQLIAFTKPPVREREFRLKKIRAARMHSSSKERRLEYKIWEFARVMTDGPILKEFCETIHSYQVPLRKHGAQTLENHGWKAVDLVGCDKNGLPAIIELKYDHGEKKGSSNETPLRMIVEAAAYGIAINHMWEFTKFKEEWVMEFHPKDPPAVLASIPLIGLAPLQYWNRFEGKLQRAGTRPEGFWESFQRLCLKLEEKGYPVQLASVKFDSNGEVSSLESYKMPAT